MNGERGGVSATVAGTNQRDLTRTLLFVLCVGGLAAAGFWTIRPFLPATIWASMIVVATWPLLLRVESAVGGRRKVAVLVMMSALLLTFIVPLVLGIATVVNGIQSAPLWMPELAELEIPHPPHWLGNLPFVGARIVESWEAWATVPHEELARRLTPYVATYGRWFLQRVGGIGIVIAHFLLTIVLSAVFWTHGESFAAAILRIASRLGGERAQEITHLAARAVRAVALGLVATAFVQSIVAGIGLLIVGVPYTSVLTAIMFVLSVALIGPLPVLAPAVIWLYWSGETGRAIVLLVWTVLVATIDNFLRPWFIRRGANLPLLLIVAGVFGGVIGFGIIGLFVGPVVLAVLHTLLVAWTEPDNSESAVPGER